MNLEKLTEEVNKSNEKFHAAVKDMGRVIVGQKALINRLYIALLSDGHILLEGLPGLAKTLAATSLAKTVNCNFKRVQFTPDLLPADLIGTSIYNPKEGTFSVNKGPIFTNILLADEINRAPAKVQSALLEVMQEHQVTIAGNTYVLDEPFFVLATQNPIEHEGTYPLPEAQTDRFMMKVKIDYPSIAEESEIIQRMATLGDIPVVRSLLTAEDIMEARKVVNSVYIDSKVTNYILQIVCATRKPADFQVDIEGLLLYGASPRASIALTIGSKAYAYLSGRAYVTPNDVKQICHDVLRHRLRRSYEAEAEDISPDDIIDRILASIPVP